MPLGEIITVINRTEHTLVVTRNGHEREFLAGENRDVPWEWLYYCKNQHPLMGSEDAENPLTGEYLLVRKGTEGWPCKDHSSPLKDEELEAIERIDRVGMPEVEIIRGRRSERGSLDRMPPPTLHSGNA